MRLWPCTLCFVLASMSCYLGVGLLSILVGILLSLETMVCAVFKAATQAWARIMEILGCPILKNPPLGLTNEIQRNASNTFGISSAAGAVDMYSVYITIESLKRQ